MEPDAQAGRTMDQPELDNALALAQVEKLRAETAKAIAETEAARQGQRADVVWRQPTTWLLLLGAIGALGTTAVQWTRSAMIAERAQADARNAEADVKLAQLRVEESNREVKALQATISQLNAEAANMQIERASIAASIREATDTLRDTSATLEQRQRALSSLDASGYLDEAALMSYWREELRDQQGHAIMMMDEASTAYTSVRWTPAAAGRYQEKLEIVISM